MSFKLHRKVYIKYIFTSCLPLKRECQSSLAEHPKKWSQKVKRIIPVSTLITMAPTTIYIYTHTCQNPQQGSLILKEGIYISLTIKFTFMWFFTKSYPSSPLSDFLVIVSSAYYGTNNRICTVESRTFAGHPAGA